MENKNISPNFNDRAQEGLEKEKSTEQNLSISDSTPEIWRDRFLEDGNDPEMFNETGKYITADKGHEHLGQMLEIQAAANEEKKEINKKSDERTKHVVGTPEMRENALEAIEKQRERELEAASKEASEHAKTYYDENFAMKLEFNRSIEKEREIDQSLPGMDAPDNEPSME